MKSYLSLVPISAKVRKRQNRMTILCVIISIFLVTAIFSVADMMIRTQSDRMTGKNGSWHIELDGISQETALKIAERDDVVSIGAVTIFNPDGELPYRMDGKRVVLYGIDESYLTMNSTGAAEGRFPQGMGEIMLSSNAARVLQVAVGDTVTLRTPSGDWDFTVSGLGGVEESYYSGQYSLMDAYLPRTAFAALLEQNNESREGVPCTRLALDQTGASDTDIVTTVWLRQADGTPFLGEIAVDGETILTVRFTKFGFCDTITDNS